MGSSNGGADMKQRGWGAAIAIATVLAAGTAYAAPCEQTMQAYGEPPREDATLTCTCGPPQGGFLGALTEALDEIDGEVVERYPGTLLQTMGAAWGTWTYSYDSNICMAAQHVGLIADPDVGAEVQVQVAPGCETYVPSVRNGMETRDRGSFDRSFFFPAVSDGGCPGTDSYRPSRLDLGTYGADGQWLAIALPRNDGSWRCSVYGRAAGSDPDQGLWLQVNDEALRYRPDTPLDDEAQARLLFDGTATLLPLAVRRGEAFMPLYAPLAATLAATMELQIALTLPGAEDAVTLVWPLDGFTEAFDRAARECNVPALADRE